MGLVQPCLLCGDGMELEEVCVCLIMYPVQGSPIKEHGPTWQSGATFINNCNLLCIALKKLKYF